MHYFKSNETSVHFWLSTTGSRVFCETFWDIDNIVREKSRRIKSGDLAGHSTTSSPPFIQKQFLLFWVEWWCVIIVMWKRLFSKWLHSSLFWFLRAEKTRAVKFLLKASEFYFRKKIDFGLVCQLYRIFFPDLVGLAACRKSSFI